LSKHAHEILQAATQLAARLEAAIVRAPWLAEFGDEVTRAPMRDCTQKHPRGGLIRHNRRRDDRRRALPVWLVGCSFSSHMLEPSATEPRYDSIPATRWEASFDAFSKALEGRRTEIEVVGLAIGDQFQVDWASLKGLSYDRKDDVFWVYLDLGDKDLEHAIPHPREILTRIGASGLEEVIVVDAEGVKQLIRLRPSLMLPPRGDREP
jgi:uncharacterized protein DUF5335